MGTDKGYIITKPAYEDAVNQAGEYTYALLYRISDILLCRAQELKADDWKECTEARLFRMDAELHLFPGSRSAVCVSDKEGAQGSMLDRVYGAGSLVKRSLGMKEADIVVRHYLEEDEDGQMTIALTRLVDIR